MKFILTIVLCSALNSTCTPPHTFDYIYDDGYDCMLDGYYKSIDKIEEIGREKVNLNQFYVKFGCTAYFPPPEEILPQPNPKIDT